MPRALCRVKPYAVAALAPCVLAFGLYNIHSRCGITEGGVLGMTLLLRHWLGVSPAWSGLVLNTACFAAGIAVLGARFARRSAVACLAFSACYAVLERFPPLLPDLSGHPLAAAVVGALFVAAGVGPAVRAGAASGGDDALAMALSRAAGIPISRAYLITDFLVLGLSLSYIAPRRIFYSLVTVTLSSALIGLMQRPSPGD